MDNKPKKHPFDVWPPPITDDEESEIGKPRNKSYIDPAHEHDSSTPVYEGEEEKEEREREEEERREKEEARKEK